MTHPKLTNAARKTLSLRIESFTSALDAETNLVAANEIRRAIALAQAELASGRFGGHQMEQLG